MKDLNLNTETLQLLRENIGNTQDIRVGKNFLSRISVPQELVPGINRWDYIKLKSLYTENETIMRAHRQPTEWEKVFTRQGTDIQNIQRTTKIKY